MLKLITTNSVRYLKDDGWRQIGTFLIFLSNSLLYYVFLLKDQVYDYPCKDITWQYNLLSCNPHNFKLISKKCFVQWSILKKHFLGIKNKELQRESAKDWKIDIHASVFDVEIFQYLFWQHLHYLSCLYHNVNSYK